MSYNHVVIVLTILFSALFSGMEIAFITANKLRIELDRKQGTFASRIVSIYTDNPGQYLSTMLVGNSIALVVYGIEIAKLLSSILHPYISGDTSLLIVQTIISTLIIIVTAEFLPKSLFRLNPNGFLNFFALPMLFFYVILYPISKFATWFSVWIIRLVLKQDISPQQKQQLFEKVDLDNLVEQAKPSEGDDDGSEHDIRMFQNALDFSEIKVRMCMIPRTDIKAISIHGSIQELKEKFTSSNFSRLPVYDGTIDNIIGYINSKDLFKRPQSIKSKLINIDYVPETMLAHQLLTAFIKQRRSIAVVVDEFGGTAGLITLEDIFEEIIGEIDDEHDEVDFVEKRLSENEYLLSGRLEVEYLNEKYKFNIPEMEDYDTLAGFIIHHFQSIPKPQEVIAIDNFRIKIAKMDRSRVDLLHFTVLDVE